MQLRKKILGYLLLAIYLLVVLHQSTLHSHSSPFNRTSVKTFHQHENFKEVHHKHQFHVGIFHFFEHLLENINDLDCLTDDYLVGFQKSAPKKVVDYNSSVNSYIYGQRVLVFEVDAESLPDPPYHLSILQKLKLPSTPLRAPPSFA